MIGLPIEKYNGSTFNGVLIEKLFVDTDSDERVNVVLDDKDGDTLAVIPLWLFKDQIEGWSADCILFDIQEYSGLKVLK